MSADKKNGRRNQRPDFSDPREVTRDIIEFCGRMGVDLVGFASAGTWEEKEEVPPEFWPRSLWPLARSVIVMGLAMPLPIVDTTPSVPHMELYRTVNRELDRLSYLLTGYLNRKGSPAYFTTRDGFGSMKALQHRNLAAFSHITAGLYAGLGNVGHNHLLLTPGFGPRVRMVSVFSTLELEPDPQMDKTLCIKCKLCARCCPSGALVSRGDNLLADFNKAACLAWSDQLTRRRCYPCGICTKVCPIGRDRVLYQEKGMGKLYLEEAEALRRDPNDPRYRSWAHLRTFGIAEGDRWPDGGN